MDEVARRSLKILCVIPSLTRGGAERVLSLLTQEWAKCHVVVVAAFDASRPAYDYHGRIVHLGLALPGRTGTCLRGVGEYAASNQTIPGRAT